MQDAPRDDDPLLPLQVNRPVFEVDDEVALKDEEELVVGIVLVPVGLPLHHAGRTQRNQRTAQARHRGQATPDVSRAVNDFVNRPSVSIPPEPSPAPLARRTHTVARGEGAAPPLGPRARCAVQLTMAAILNQIDHPYVVAVSNIGDLALCQSRSH